MAEEAHLPRHQARWGLYVIQAYLEHLLNEMLTARIRARFLPVI